MAAVVPSANFVAVLCEYQLLLYLPVADIMRRYLQHLYGRHLDRIELSLRELTESASTTAS